VNVVFRPASWADYLQWQREDEKILERINLLVEECRRDPFRGMGKPEPLRQNLAGWWSRRISSEHRLVYRVRGSGDDQVIEILSCRYHY
jgi:toxin YoeB